MISAFAPLLPGYAGRAAARKTRTGRRTRSRPADIRSLTWCALLFALLLQGAMVFRPQLLLVSPVQAGTVFKMASGYGMAALMAFAIAFGALRRMPAMAPHLRRLNELHQVAGLLVLVLLASHAGQRPAGFLLWTFHAMALGVAGGALRAIVGVRMGRALSTALLAVHIVASCLVAAAALLHLYFVYAYTA